MANEMQSTGHFRYRIRPQILPVFLVALALLLAGMRVPDLSRPHRPKPRPRAVVTNQLKSVPELFKQHSPDIVAVVSASPTPDTPSFFCTSLTEVTLHRPSTHLIVHSGRSPPPADC